MIRRILPLAFALPSGACLLTNPVGDPPQQVTRRPYILHDESQPPITAPLTALPNTTLTLAVDADPASQLSWALFVDFDPQSGFPDLEGSEGPDVTLRTPRRISIDLGTSNIDDRRCHTITVFVANDFEKRAGWRPRPPGGDLIVWFYRPAGALGPCPVTDAGAFPDVVAPLDTGVD